MTLQIQRGKSVNVYRINEFNDREIVWRPNRHNARWKHFQTCQTPEEARAVVLQLEKETKQ